MKLSTIERYKLARAVLVLGIASNAFASAGMGYLAITTGPYESWLFLTALFAGAGFFNGFLLGRLQSFKP